MLAAVTVLWAAIRLETQERSTRQVALFAALGAFAVWFSHSAVFVLAGVSLVMVGNAVARKNRIEVIQAVTASGGWILSFGLFALIGLRSIEGVQRSLVNLPGSYSSTDVTRGAFSEEGALRSMVGALRYVTAVPHFLEYRSFDAGSLLAAAAALAAVFGLIILSRKSVELAAFLVSPLVVMLAAWALDRYPVLGRTQVFLIPSYILLLSEGLVTAVRWPRSRWMSAAALTIAGAVIVAIVAPAMALCESFGRRKT